MYKYAGTLQDIKNSLAPVGQALSKGYKAYNDFADQYRGVRPALYATSMGLLSRILAGQMFGANYKNLGLATGVGLGAGLGYYHDLKRPLTDKQIKKKVSKDVLTGASYGTGIGGGLGATVGTLGGIRSARNLQKNLKRKVGKGKLALFGGTLGALGGALGGASLGGFGGAVPSAYQAVRRDME